MKIFSYTLMALLMMAFGSFVVLALVWYCGMSKSLAVFLNMVIGALIGWWLGRRI